MKTAGELLKNKREEKGLAVKDVAVKLKVKEAYLEAIENNAFKLLPSPTFIKGLLRSYASLLYLNPDTILAMFRRDFTEQTDGQIIAKGLLEPVSHRPHIFSLNLIIIIVSALTLFIFLGYQLSTWFSYPKLDVTSPINGEIYLGKVIVRGVTDKDSIISINNQKVLVGDKGEFVLDLNFSEGTQMVLIQAENRVGKIRLVQRTFQVAN